ncbi:MAG: AAA family ATPase [Planctomycetota bacterium]
MRLERLRLKNFRVFQDLDIADVPPLCVIVGANGSGKSTFFEVFAFLRRCLATNVRSAVGGAAGFRNLVSRGHEKEGIEIELQFRTDITGVNRLVTYVLEVELKDNNPVIRREVLRYKRGEHGAPFRFIDFAYGKGKAVSNEEDFNKPDEDLTREAQELDSPGVLAIKGLGQFQRFKAANALRQLLESWHVSDLHIEEARGAKTAEGYDDHLSVSGDNLQRVALRLKEDHPDRFAQVLDTMKRRVPGVTEIQTESSLDGRLLLKFRDGAFQDPFIDATVSDGTLKMFAYLVLLHDPKPFPLLCVEEPENQLYPKLLPELAEEFRAYAQRGGQVFVSTHSPDFLGAIELEELFWLVKRNGFTTMKRAKDDPQVAAQMAEAGHLGYLWSEGFFEGADPS